MATETKMAAVDRRMAERLRSRGWQVYGPHEVLSVMVETGLAFTGAGRKAVPTRVTLEVRPRVELEDPCASGCSDPERHAEGGHDV